MTALKIAGNERAAPGSKTNRGDVPSPEER